MYSYAKHGEKRQRACSLIIGDLRFTVPCLRPDFRSLAEGNSFHEMGFSGVREHLSLVSTDLDGTGQGIVP